MADARNRLREAGISPVESELGARLLAEFMLGWTTERFFSSADEPAPAGFADGYRQLVDRRALREPLAYIVGRREFWGLSFEVSPAVMIPRPETELMVETALALFPAVDHAMTIADVCTGSGCVGIALATERPEALVTAVDLSGAALAVAGRNAVLHGVAGRIRCVLSDLLEGIHDSFDLIVANPPYIRDYERVLLQREVRDHEPSLAFFGGPDGFDVIERFVAQVPARLRTGGALLFEFGFGQDLLVEAVIERTAGLMLVDLKRDLQGIARIAVARRT